MATSTHTGMSSAESIALGEFGPPPGLVKHADVRPPPGLECGRLPFSLAQVTSPPQSSPIGGLEQDPLWNVYQEYMQHRCRQYEQPMRTNERADLKCKQPCGATPMSCLPTKIDVQGMKPPGIFERVGSNHSLASTAATTSEEPKNEEPDFTGVASALEPSVALAEKPKCMLSRELHVEHLSDGGLKVHWPMDARKLRGKDKQIVSSGFDIFPGGSFKLMVISKGASFHKSSGHGSVHLKFMGDAESAPELCFRISVAGESPRGPITHDFHSSPIGGLAKIDENFDFKSSADQDSSTCFVFLEILPNSLGLQCRS